jgi:hypothetical protein
MLFAKGRYVLNIAMSFSSSFHQRERGVGMDKVQREKRTVEFYVLVAEMK